MDISKSATSLIFAAAGNGTLLPPYIVYESVNLYDSWTTAGPRDTRYNRSKSGWFYTVSFSDWFTTIALPYCKKVDGREVLVGDNLGSHLSLDVINLCEKNNIAFVFLPPNSTHICQPLDVAFFRPLKSVWRFIMDKRKRR